MAQLQSPSLLLVASILIARVSSFVILPSLSPQTQLFDGFGVADSYRWTEDAQELEITVSVPPKQRTKDIKFRARPNSVDLKYLSREDGLVTLLDGERPFRGKVDMSGTFWNLQDSEGDGEGREIVVTVEKQTKTPHDEYAVIDYDWGGVYEEDEEEVTERVYKEPEQLDIREYAAEMGIDIDNINMSLVDKTMYSSGLNMTRNTMDQLTKSGYVQEVTQQADGKESVTGEDGEQVPFSRLGEAVSEEEMQQAVARPQIPFLDTESPWTKSAPSKPDDTPKVDLNSDEAQTTADSTTDEAPPPSSKKSNVPEAELIPVDPVEKLTVKRLKEILGKEGLKVSGKKAELQERLRNHIAKQVQR